MAEIAMLEIGMMMNVLVGGYLAMKQTALYDFYDRLGSGFSGWKFRDGFRRDNVFEAAMLEEKINAATLAGHPSDGSWRCPDARLWR